VRELTVVCSERVSIFFFGDAQLSSSALTHSTNSANHALPGSGPGRTVVLDFHFSYHTSPGGVQSCAMFGITMKGCSFPFLSFFLYVSVLYLLMGLIFFLLFHVSPFSCVQEQWQARGRVGVVLLGVTGGSLMFSK
jgi:hypothetical protein